MSSISHPNDVVFVVEDSVQNGSTFDVSSVSIDTSKMARFIWNVSPGFPYFEQNIIFTKSDQGEFSATSC